jgi:hypothetical protein
MLFIISHTSNSDQLHYMLSTFLRLGPYNGSRLLEVRKIASLYLELLLIYVLS